MKKDEMEDYKGEEASCTRSGTLRVRSAGERSSSYSFLRRSLAGFYEAKMVKLHFVRRACPAPSFTLCALFSLSFPYSYARKSRGCDVEVADGKPRDSPLLLFLPWIPVFDRRFEAWSYDLVNFKSYDTLVSEKNASSSGKKRWLLNKTHDGRSFGERYLLLLLYSADTSLSEYFQNANSIEDLSLRSILLTYDFDVTRLIIANFLRRPVIRHSSTSFWESSSFIPPLSSSKASQLRRLRGRYSILLCLANLRLFLVFHCLVSRQR